MSVVITTSICMIFSFDLSPGPGFDYTDRHRNFTLAAKIVNCIHTSTDKGTVFYSQCPQSFRMGVCAIYQPAAGPFPVRIHKLFHLFQCQMVERVTCLHRWDRMAWAHTCTTQHSIKSLFQMELEHCMDALLLKLPTWQHVLELAWDISIRMSALDATVNISLQQRQFHTMSLHRMEPNSFFKYNLQFRQVIPEVETRWNLFSSEHIYIFTINQFVNTIFQFNRLFISVLMIDR